MTTLETSIPSTWNEGAALAVAKIADFPKPIPGLAISEIRLCFSSLEEDYARHSQLSLPWAGVGAAALKYAWHSGNRVDIDELVQTLCRKQADYGHDNIRRFGTYGVIVRCHDKIARLEHLFRTGRDPKNESVRDNLMDVAGYAAIGIMLENGWFEKELEL